MDDDLSGRLAALAAVGPRLEAAAADPAQFGEWVPAERREDGVWSMPYVRYGELERAFRGACAGWVRPDIDWMAWAQTDEFRGFERDPARIATATPEQLARLLTTIIRGDRFNEGNLLGAFERGHLTAIASRARILADDPAALAAALAEDARGD